MPKAFLKKKSIIDKFRDDYGQQSICCVRSVQE